MNGDCSYEMHFGTSLGKKQSALKTTPMDAEVGIPLTYQLIDSACKEHPGQQMEPLKCLRETQIYVPLALSSVGWRLKWNYTGSMVAGPTAFITWSTAYHVQCELQKHSISCAVQATDWHKLSNNKDIPHEHIWTQGGNNTISKGSTLVLFKGWIHGLDEGVKATAVQWFQQHFREYLVEEIHWLVCQ